MSTLKHHINFSSNIPTLLLLSTAIVTAAIPLRWVLSSHFYFLGDDWTWLYKAQFVSYKQLFTILPAWYYNDRAFGSVFIKLIYEIFGPNNVIFHLALLSLHLLNVVLVFYIAKYIFKSIIHAFFVSFLFGSYIAALTAVTSVGAVFDVFSNTLILSSILLYFQGNKYIRATSYIALFLAFRTKEVAILTPLFLLFYELIGTDKPINKDNLLQAIKQTKWYLLMEIFFLLYYLRLFFTLHLILPSTDPYYDSVKISTFLNGLAFYIAKLLYVPLPQLVTLLILLLTIGYLVIRNARVGLFGIIGFLLFLSPVIFLINHRYEVYLYIPLFPFILFGYDFLMHASKELMSLAPIPKIYKNNYYYCAVVFLATAYYFTNIHNGYYKSEVSWYLNLSNIYSTNINFIKQLVTKPKTYSDFYVSNLPANLNVFDDGPCYSLKVIYRDDSLQCIIYKSPEELQEKYTQDNNDKYFLNYENGQLAVKQY